MLATLWERLFAITFVVTLALLVIQLSSQHRIRLIVESFRTVHAGERWEPHDSTLFLPHSSFSDAPSFSNDMAVLSAFDRSYPLTTMNAVPVVDQPDTCLNDLREGMRLHCYNVDIAMSLLLAHTGAPSRMWDFNGASELGGNGHNLLEVFDGGSRHWKVIDPYYHCYFIQAGDSEPLNVLKLRELLLTNTGEVHLVRYSDTLGERPDSEIIAELKYLTPSAMLHENNNYTWRYDHRYAWLTGIASPLFDALPIRFARGIRTIMLGSRDRLIVLDDAFSPHFPYTEMQIIYWVLLVGLVISAAGYVVAVRQKTALVSRSPHPTSGTVSRVTASVIR